MSPTHVQRLKQKLLDRPRPELFAHLALVAAAFAVRLIDLGDRPFHHDESQDAYFSWVFFDKGDYEYNPLLHGPLRFYLTAAVYGVFGDSDFTARLAPVLMGTIMVGLPYLLRRQIGSVAAFATALLLAFGPTYLYFSRFAREDIYVSAINLGLIVAIFRYLDRPWRGGPAVIGVLLALAFATKESTFITVAIVGGFFSFLFLYERRGIVVLPIVVVAVGLVTAFASLAVVGVAAGLFLVWVLVEALIPSSGRPSALAKQLGAVGAVPWIYGVSAFAFVFALLFTVFFTDPDGVKAGLVDGVKYWAEQQDVARGGEPWYFYFAVLFGHEWPAIVLGAVGAVVCLRRRTTLDLFLVFFFVASLAAYCKGSERFAWLVMHPLLPLLVLAGVGVQAIWAARGGLRAVGLAVTVACFAYAGIASYLANAVNRADPKEFLVSTQSSEDVNRVRDRVLELDRRLVRETGNHVTITIDSRDGATYPWAWYFRHLPVGYIDMSTEGFVPKEQVLIMTEASRTALLPNLAAYDGRRPFRFRVWWVRDWTKKFSLSAWKEWFLHRTVWNPVGGMPEYIYVRRDAEAVAGS